MKFKDHFSGHAAEYAKFRPRYPDELFTYLASMAPNRGLAWDCATGNGQAAIALAEHFESVIATDASAKQLENAARHERVHYRVAPAEESGIESESVDLVTVAQALHWFDIEAFFAEARRALKPNGIISVWCYNLISITAEIDAIVRQFYDETVGTFWPPERAMVEAGYRMIDFPFNEIETPSFQMKTRWTLADLLGYVLTWSATQQFIATNKHDPVGELACELRNVWANPSMARLVTWPLSLHVGRVPAQRRKEADRRAIRPSPV